MPTSFCPRKAVSREPLGEGLDEPPESLARGTLSEGFPTNVGDLFVSAGRGGTGSSRDTEIRGDGHVPGTAHELSKAVVVALLRAPQSRHEDDHRWFVHAAQLLDDIASRDVRRPTR